MVKISRIGELLKEQCPNGVDFVKLKDIATVSGAGVDKKIIPGEKSVILLNYMDIFKNGYLDKSIPTMEVTASDRKIEQCSVLKGDIFFTPTSENIEEIGIAAVSTEDMMGVVYSYHIMRIRLNKANYTTSQFIRYMFEGEVVRRQIEKYAKGITRYGLTKTQWEQIEIPLPPLPVQAEIVRILDTFTELTSELTAELTAEHTARKKQYEFYREELLTFDGLRGSGRVSELLQGLQGIEYKKLGDICKLIRGVRVTKRNLNPDGKYPVISGGATPMGRLDRKNRDGNSVTVAQYGSAGVVLWQEEDFWANDVCYTFELGAGVSERYLYHVLKSKQLIIDAMVNRDAVPYHLPRNVFETLIIPIPSLAEQEHIVSILDQFDTLTNSLTEGIPHEIALRQKQYEFYREKLLTFKRRA